VIDLKVTAIGTKEIAQKLGLADAGIQTALRLELSYIGDEIVRRAQAAAPRRSGELQSRIRWYFGREVKRKIRDRQMKGFGGHGASAWAGYRRVIVDEEPSKHASKAFRNKYAGAIFWTVRPFGRVAHLMERGVNATFYQRSPTKFRRDADLPLAEGQFGPKERATFAGPFRRYQRSLRIAPRPFFMPAVDSVGGSAGVNARLQGALDRMAGDLTRAP
jgi:hypothetical protein